MIKFMLRHPFITLWAVEAVCETVYKIVTAFAPNKPIAPASAPPDAVVNKTTIYTMTIDENPGGGVDAEG